MTELASRLAEVYDRADLLWTRYREQGPGKVDAQSFRDLQVAHAAAFELLDGDVPDSPPAGWDSQRMMKLRDVLNTLLDLSRRCVCQPQGLCFVTGEAGLVPRRELHDTFERSLVAIDRDVRELRSV